MSKGFTIHDRGPVLMKSSVIDSPHAFTTKQGGVSIKLFTSLNLGENRGDIPANVERNYSILGKALGFDYKRLVFPRQVHGNTVRIVSEADIRPLFTLTPYEADGLVTNQMDLPLIVFSADCVPILLEDPENRVVGAVHAGWRGSAADIMGTAVEAMMSLGAKPQKIRAAIGPSIGTCCFEVRDEVAHAVTALLGGRSAQTVIHRREDEPDKFFVDLRGVNRQRLLQLGLRDESIEVSGDCTRCNSTYFWSHRLSGDARGSQAAVIFLR